MRLILEGGCGHGKTTLANKLSAITAVPVYRPFRKPGTHISTGEMERARQSLGLSINGWEEDIYVADMLASINASVILDRSMPSALAYNEASSSPLVPVQRRSVLRLWVDRMITARAILVLLAGNEEVRSRRSPLRGGAWEDKAINDVIAEIGEFTNQIPIWRVWTDRNGADVLSAAVARAVTLGQINRELIEVIQQGGG